MIIPNVAPWKRPLDLVLLALTAPAWMPISALLTIWIAAVSGRPVFFRQVRIGRHAATFAMWKFRTMRVGAKPNTHEQHTTSLWMDNAPMTKLDAHDTRLIPGARWIRALGLDELGQIINVVRGEMSLVGPRPCLPYEAQQCKELLGLRTAVLPGITGWWQVCGKNRTTCRRMLTLDTCYVRKMCPALDLWIILATVRAVASGALELLPDRMAS